MCDFECQRSILFSRSLFFHFRGRIRRCIWRAVAVSVACHSACDRDLCERHPSAAPLPTPPPRLRRLSVRRTQLRFFQFLSWRCRCARYDVAEYLLTKSLVFRSHARRGVAQLDRSQISARVTKNTKKACNFLRLRACSFREPVLEGCVTFGLTLCISVYASRLHLLAAL